MTVFPDPPRAARLIPPPGAPPAAEGTAIFLANPEDSSIPASALLARGGPASVVEADGWALSLVRSYGYDAAPLLLTFDGEGHVVRVQTVLGR